MLLVGCNSKQELVLETNWVVVTGAPSAGKSTTVEELKRLGFQTEPEYARQYYFDLSQAFITRGLDIADLRSEANIPQNQEAIYRHRVKTAETLDPNSLVILDTGIPESMFRLIMYAKQGLEIDSNLIAEAKQNSVYYRYRKIFHLERLDFVADGIRTEDQQMIRRLDRLTKQVYQKLGYDVISVPKFSEDINQSVQARVDFIREQL